MVGNYLYNLYMINMKSVKKYCSEDISQIENFEEANNSQDIWECHHRLEYKDGVYRKVKDLVAAGLYFHRPASELIFMTRHEHRSLHGTERPISEDTRRKISANKIGKPTNVSDEGRRRLSESMRRTLLREYSTTNRAERHSEWMKNFYKNKENIEVQRSCQSKNKCVVQYDFDGNEVARYRSMREAERKTGINHCIISKCCSGKLSNAGGYSWVSI